MHPSAHYMDLRGEQRVSALNSAIPTELIVSSDKFSKDGLTFSAGFDPATGSVCVLQGSVPANNLRAHLEKTQASGTAAIVALFNESGVAAEPNEIEQRRTRSFVYLPTSRCNMGCTYCGQNHTNDNSGSKVDKKFLRRVTHALSSEQIRHVHVAWFGGEPLLAFRTIMDLSSNITAHAEQQSKRYTSKITTNGALLTPRRMRQLVEEAQVSRFDITIDGPLHTHNTHRPLKNGGGSFDNIMRTLEWYRDAQFTQPATVVLRTNVDRENQALVPTYLEQMCARGFTDSSKFLFEISPIHSWGNDVTELALTTPEAANAEVTWMELMEELGLPFGLLPGRPTSVTCAATDRYSEVIGSDGSLFSCTETPLTKQAAHDTLGNVEFLPLSIVRPEGQFNSWDSMVENGQVPCSSCQLRRTCRGACPKQWSEGNVPCPTLKLNFDQRMVIFMRRHKYARVENC